MLDSDDCLVKEDSNSDLKSEEGIGSGPFMHNICVWCVQYISVLFGHDFIRSWKKQDKLRDIPEERG